MKELKTQMEASKDAPATQNYVSIAVASDELKHLQAEIDRVEKSHQQRSELFEKEVEEYKDELKAKGLAGPLQTAADETSPRLINISSDPMMSGRWMYMLVHRDQDIMIGTKNREDENDQRIVILCNKASNVQGEHATINLSNEAITILPNNPETCDLYVNGRRIEKQTNIYHNDRIVFGNGQVCFHLLSSKHPSTKPLSSLEFDYDYIVQEMQKEDEEVIRLREQLITNRGKRESRQQLVNSIRERMDKMLRKAKLEESKIRMVLEEEVRALREEVQNATVTQTLNLINKNEKNQVLAEKLKEVNRSRMALEKIITKKSELFDKCEQFDNGVEEQIAKAVTLCRLSEAMAKLNNIDSRYSTTLIPFWDDEVGLPNEKVMVRETFHFNGSYIDNIYDFDCFLERHVAHAEYESRDRSKKSVNPFVPDMPTRHIGQVCITDTRKSVEPYDFAIEAFAGGYSGVIKAWLNVECEDKECEITLTIDDIVINNRDDQNLTKVVTFINIDGTVEIVECGLADDCESFYFPSIKMIAQASPYVEQYMKNQGVMVFVSVYAFTSDIVMPLEVFHKCMDCQIELRRCKEFMDEMEQKLKVGQLKLLETEGGIAVAEKEHKIVVDRLEAKNMKLTEKSSSTSQFFLPFLKITKNESM